MERQKPSEPPAQPRAAMGTSVLLHISLRDLESGCSVSLLGLTEPCEDYMHCSKKGGENHLSFPQRQSRALGIPRGCYQMRSAEHGRSPSRGRSLPHTLPASPTAYNEHRINRADLRRQPRASPSFTGSWVRPGPCHTMRAGKGLPCPSPGLLRGTGTPARPLGCQQATAQGCVSPAPGHRGPASPPARAADTGGTGG